MRNIVVSFGGSILVPRDNEFNIDILKRFYNLIKEMKETRFIIVVGGGRLCRRYVEFGTALDCKEEDLHWIGIMATRLNAELVRSYLGGAAYKEVIYNPRKKTESDKILVAAGYKPGFSTDNDAVLLAKTYGAEEIINLTNVDYVYDKDPKTSPDAKPLERVGWKEMRKMVGKKSLPGINAPFDPIASKNAEKMNLKVIVMNGNDLSDLDNYLNGKPFKGTVIHDG